MKANLRRSKHRDREKREKMFLRAYSAMLEDELAQLQNKQRQEQREGTVDLAMRSPHRKLWRTLALVRRRERESSEQENARLRALWQSQLLFAAQLQQHMSVLRGVGPANGLEARATICEADSDLFKVLLGDLDDTYRGIGRVMAETGLDFLPEAHFHSIRPRNVSGAGREAEAASAADNVDVISIDQLRGDFPTIQDAMWRDMVTQIILHGCVRFDLAEAHRENAMAFKGQRFQQDDAGKTICLETSMVSRKYRTSPDCVTVAWRCLFTTSGGASNVTTLESGFSVSSPSVSQPEFYTMRRCRRLETIQSTASTLKERDGAVVDEAAEMLKSMSLSVIEDDIQHVLDKVVVPISPEAMTTLSSFHRDFTNAANVMDRDPSELSDAFPASILDAIEPLSPASTRFFTGSDWCAGDPLGFPHVVSPIPSSAAATQEAPHTTGTPAAPIQKPRAKCRRTPASNLKANLRRSKHRDAEKREVMFLKAHAQALEQELAQLQQRKEALLTAESERPRPEMPPPRLKVRQELWKSLTLVRRSERKRSEEENARLTALWKAQRLFLAQLQQIVSVPGSLGPAGGDRARITFSEVDVEVFDTLVGDLDTLYSQHARVLAETGLAGLPEANYQSIQHRDGVGTGSMDLLNVVILRSGYACLRVDIWRDILAKFLARDGAQFHESCGEKTNTVAMKMRYQATPGQIQQTGGAQVNDRDVHEDGDEELLFEVVLAIRKYRMGPDRELTVWKSLNFGDGGLSGLVANETGYCIMHRSLLYPEFTTLKRIRRVEAMKPAEVPQMPTREADAGHDDEEASPVEDLLSSLSLVAMEDDVDGALRSVGYD